MKAVRVSRIDSAFARLRDGHSRGLVTYTTAGDPDLPTSMQILRALDEAGADVLEVGVPFSDPLADGPVIQRAAERALAAGATLDRILDALGEVRPGISAPIVIFTYANPVLRLGVDRFAERAAAAGVDGVLVLDLPIEEAEDFRDRVGARGIDMIFLLSPTTTDARIKRAAELGRGFLYAISRLGVTGSRDAVAASARDLVARIRRVTDMPVALGFGISQPEHVREVCAYADAAVVGSALVEAIADAHQEGFGVMTAAKNLVLWLKGDYPITTAEDGR
jgi:tryptophan synthase alpha chain